jgi:hypothetical protein
MARSPATLALQHLPSHAPRRHQAVCVEGLDTNRRVGPHCRPAALQRTAGRRAAGQPQRAAQRDRVLRVCAEAAGLRRRRGRPADVPDMLDVVARARELDALAGAAGRAAVGDAAHQQRGLVGGLCAAGGRRLGLVPGALPGGWCCPAAKRAHRRCWCWPWTRRPRWPTTRRPPSVRECTLSLDVPQVHRPARSPSRPGTSPPARWPTTWTPHGHGRPGPGHHAARLDAAIGKELESCTSAGARDLAAGTPAARRCSADGRCPALVPCRRRRPGIADNRPPQDPAAELPNCAAAAPPRAPLLRAGRAGGARRRVRPLFQELQALEAAHPHCARRFAHAARAGPVLDGFAPVRTRADAVSIRTETDTTPAAPRPSTPVCAASWS